MTYLPLHTSRRQASFVFVIVDDYRAPATYTDLAANAKRDCEVMIYNAAGFFAGEMVQNRSGLFYAVNLLDGFYEAVVSSRDFIPMRVPFEVAGFSIALREVRLQPGYGYWFPEGVTYIRGKVVESGTTKPLAQVRVEAQGRAEFTCTDETGRFLIYFKPGTITAGETIVLNFNHASYGALFHHEAAFQERARVTLPGAMEMVKL